MIKLTDIYASVSKLLKENYGLKVYGNEVKEGYTRPSFFVQLLPVQILNSSTNFHEESYSIVITYFQPQPDSLDNYKKVDSMRELFGQKLNIGTRAVNVTDFSYNFVGEKSDVLQVYISVEFFNGIKKVDTAPPVGEVNINKEVR